MAARSGHATSAIRFYEDEGLVVAGRTAAGHRTYRRHVLRRLAFIRSAQRVGLTLDEIRDLLDVLPADRAPTKAQWGSLSRAMRRRLDARDGRAATAAGDPHVVHRVRVPEPAVVPALEPR